MPSLSHMILVCCHGTYKGPDPWQEQSWILQPFQKSNPSTGKRGEHETFVAHIEAGHRLMMNDPEALLVFSGAKTQNEVNTSEAQSYRDVWSAMLKLDECRQPATETLATDSYQNLLFSIILFRKRVGAYPKNITVITHAFKERRFLELHAPAIRWSSHRIRVMGINPPFTLDELAKSQDGESMRGYNAFAQDLYGVRSPLCDKRIVRNWDERSLKLLGEDLEVGLNQLLSFRGGESGRDIISTRMPWET